MDDRGFDELSVSEQILRVQDLWDRIATSQSGAVELTDEQLAELEGRLRAHETSPGEYVTWDELRARLSRDGR